MNVAAWSPITSKRKRLVGEVESAAGLTGVTMEVVVVGCEVPRSSVDLARSSNTFKIRRARVDDMTTIIGLIEEAAAWLQTKGTDQWAAPWPDLKARDERVIHSLGATFRRARQSYSLLHELAHSDLSASQDSFVLHRVVVPRPQDIVRSPNPTTFASELVPFSSFRSFSKNGCVNALHPRLNSSYTVDAAQPAFSLWQETNSAEPVPGPRNELTAEVFTAAAQQRAGISFYLRVNRVYAAVLADVCKGIMVAAMLVVSMVVGIMAKANIIVASTVAVIATIMSHRHRHEPPDGFILQTNANMDPWRVAVDL